MESTDLITLLLAVIGTLGGASAWQFYQKRLEIRASREEKETEQRFVFRDDLRERVAVLESRLEDSRAVRDQLQESLRLLSEETAALRVEVQFLREERDTLKGIIDKLTKQLNGKESEDGTA